MSVRTAVERRDQAVETATRQRSPAEALKASIDNQARQYAAVLPRGYDAERYSRLVLNACKQAPDLISCFETRDGAASLMLAAMQCAVIGLEPNTPLQQAWLLPRRRSVKTDGGGWTKVWEAQLSIGYRGLIKLARRGGNLSTIYAEVVYEADEFHWHRGLAADELHYRRAEQEDRGERRCAYAVARFKDDSYTFVVVDRWDVEKRRAMSDSWKSDEGKPADKQYSPWNKWPDEMWRKTAVRVLAPYLDLSAEAAAAVAGDERSFEWNTADGSIDVAPLALDDGQPPEPAELEAEGEPAGTAAP